MPGAGRRDRSRLPSAVSVAPLAVLLLILATMAAGGPAAARSLGRGTISSRSTDAAVNTHLAWAWHGEPAGVLFRLAEQHRLARLLVWVPPGVTSDRAEVARLKHLITAARARRIAVDALGGDPSWARTPDVARQWGQEVALIGGFRRLHLNIEPHADPSWTTDRAALVTGLLTALASARRAGLPVDADVPFWYSSVAGPDPGSMLDAAVLKIVDSITVMAYQPTAPKVLAAAEAPMRTAAAAGKPAYIGMNLLKPAEGSADGTFWGQPTATVLEAINQVDAGGRRWASYRGLALHDAASLLELNAQGG